MKGNQDEEEDYWDSFEEIFDEQEQDLDREEDEEETVIRDDYQNAPGG